MNSEANKVLSAEDERLIVRYVDGLLGAEERAAFDARCESDAALRAALADARQVRQVLACDRDLPAREAEAFAPSPGFVDGVLRAARRLPARSELVDEGEVVAEVVGSGSSALALADATRLATTVRHALVAAVLVCGAALVLFGGVLRQNDTGRLQASPQELRSLDERIERARAAGKIGGGAREPAKAVIPADRGR